MSLTEIDVRADGVGIITLQSPPVNQLNTPVKNHFCSNFSKLVADPQVKAIVVSGAGSFFSGGFDLNEFAAMTHTGDKSSYKDVLGEMIDLIDGSPKTTVAAVNGSALGGGFEVALACHYRVAVPDASIGFPEVTLGLLPGAHGTQRLPRLAGLVAAADIILQGNFIKASKVAAGVIDIIADSGSVLEKAAELAISKPPRPISAMAPAKNEPGIIEKAVNTYRIHGAIAHDAIGTCLQAACSIPFRDGLKVEAKNFVDLLFSVQSKALRHIFAAERAASKVPGINAKAAPLKKIGIVGAGLMGGGIAMCFAQRGIPVVLKDAKQEWLDDGLKKIIGLWEAQAKRGKLTADAVKNLIGLIHPTLKYEDLADVDAVIEAVPEIMDLKQQIFKDLDKCCKPSASLWTNTSGLNIEDISSVLKDPSRVMGCHFFSPANVMQLLENVRCANSSEQTLSNGMAMGKLINKKTVMVGNCDGFVGNRMFAPYMAEARVMNEEGASIDEIETAAKQFGMPMGPFLLSDLIGQELTWKQRKALGDMTKQTKTYIGPYDLTDWLCDLGRFGMKTADPAIKANGRGVYIHKGKEVYIDPEVVAKIEEIRTAKSIVPRSFTPDEITERLFYGLINEGFKILEEGYATRPSDIDIIYLYGYSFPRVKGGPMFYAENYVGLPVVLEKLRIYAAMTRDRYTSNARYSKVDYFEPSALLEECVAKIGTTKTSPGQSVIEVVLSERRAAGLAAGPSKL